MKPFFLFCKNYTPGSLLAVFIFLFTGPQVFSSCLNKNMRETAVISLKLDSLPLQLNINQGSTEIYQFDKPVTGVLSRNLNVVELSVAGNQMTITGLNPGRTGLKITAEGIDY